MSKSYIDEPISETSEAKLQFTVENISKLVEFWSSSVIIHGLNWNIQILKVNKTSNMEDDHMGVYLHCVNEKRISNWNCAAWALVKLISFNSENLITKLINPDVYDSVSGWGISEFITWSDLFNTEKNFVENDAIKIEVIIKANLPVIGDGHTLFESLDRCCASALSGHYRWTVPNVGNLLATCSPQFFLGGLPWEISVFRVGTQTGHVRDLFGISLRCKNSRPNWSWNVTISLSFLSLIENGMKVSFKQNINECVFNSNNPNASFVLLWHNLINPERGIINNDSAVIECEIRLRSPINNDLVNPRKRRFQVELQCAICLENIIYQRVLSTQCGHLFCAECIEKAIELRKFCPMCNTEVRLDNLRRIHLPMYVFHGLYIQFFFTSFSTFC